MDLGWLLAGAIKSIALETQGLLTQDRGMLAIVGALLFTLIPLRALVRRARRIGRARAKSLTLTADAIAQSLKEELRIRLAEPAGLFADPACGAPTLGAGEAFEDDIEAAARSVVVEAGGQRVKAKQILRDKVEGGGGGNGSEAGYWRQLGALCLIDSAREALEAYSRAADLTPHCAKTQMLLGVLSMRAGKLDAAEAAFRRQMRLSDGSNGASDPYRAGTMIGDVHAARGSFAEALRCYHDAQQGVLARLQQEPENPALQRDLSVTFDRIGDAHAANGDLDAALESYGKGLEIAKAIADGAAANADWQRDVSVSHERIGEILKEKGDCEGALRSQRNGLAIAEGLALRDPARKQWQWDLSASLDRMGDILAAMGRADEALESYRRGLKIAERVVEREGANLQWQRDLAVSYHTIGAIEAKRLNPLEAREVLEKGRAIIARLERIASYHEQWRSDLSRFDATIRTLGP
jgi:tetratricopeptide (TPR) repeat protein